MWLETLNFVMLAYCVLWYTKRYSRYIQFSPLMPYNVLSLCRKVKSVLQRVDGAANFVFLHQLIPLRKYEWAINNNNILYYSPFSPCLFARLLHLFEQRKMQRRLLTSDFEISWPLLLRIHWCCAAQQCFSPQRTRQRSWLFWAGTNLTFVELNFYS